MAPDLSGRRAAALVVLLLVATGSALAGWVLPALIALGLLLLVLLELVVDHVRARRWDARVARWDRPEVWAILDAVRDRQQAAERNQAAWKQLHQTLASIFEAFGDAYGQVERAVVDVYEQIAPAFGAFDRSGMGFADRLIAEELARPRDPEVPYL